MRPRPLVDYVVPTAPAQVLDRLRASLDAEDGPCEGHVGRQELTLVLRKPHRRFWSPYISLEVRALEDGTHVRGRFGPHPELWTLFVAIYAAQVFGFIGGLMFGMAQLLSGQTPTGLVFAVLPLIGLACSCGVDLTGRRYSRSQMAIIRDHLERVLPDAVDQGDPDL